MAAAWGTVSAVEGEHALVRMDESGCGRCREVGGCGGNHLAKLLCATPRTFRVPNPERRAVGEYVRVRIGAGSLRRSALAAYVFPLLALLIGALAGSAWAGELGAIGGALAGLLVGWLGLRRAQRRDAADPRCQPSITS
ncbi:MAG: Sigma-E factor regulatory protein RseC [Candidatus Accumulibacter regalis]|jgi:sigma-E factor negative regulatory protein RseC|uniref:Sigma-E factor regulatory protein RseC n=1 Tax=Accumulibacter regalis TaxID=522306 RepID=A0A011NU63_ACCRE|nr:SoxR reducing system RseC family protein [Accumulibacter sp.]EXI86288.1 MAG: Sigma-E factor regulatory protein RseC [Candidatus Accumulibacter regalis]HRE71468.1 SoxR reducing system RseC family protein [Accumulibacter sp.]HRE85554.1 SoxR reducing system RseC family protein [Accumulibacter sp.]